MAEIQTETTVELKLDEDEAFVVLRALEASINSSQLGTCARGQALHLRDLIGCAIDPDELRLVLPAPKQKKQ